MLEVLNRALMFLCRFARGKGAQVLALPARFISFAGINTEFAGFEFADHSSMGCRPSISRKPTVIGETTPEYAANITAYT